MSSALNNRGHFHYGDPTKRETFALESGNQGVDENGSWRQMSTRRDSQGVQTLTDQPIPEKKMAAKSIFDRFFYHGGPTSIEKFDFAFTNQGTDQNGSGFYFITDRTVANGYCEVRESNKQVNGNAGTPTLHKVRLKILNPLPESKIQPLRYHQVRTLLLKSPMIDEALEGFGEMAREGKEKLLNQAIANLVDNDESTLIKTLNTLSYDFFGDHIEAFNLAVKEVLGYDGVIAKNGKDWTAVAWFPDQIEIVSRTPKIQRTHEDEGPGASR